jgi:ABC-2 type transport system ATP-binding protein
VDSPDAAEVAARLDGRVEHREGEQLVVRHGDPVALNAELVREGLRVAALRPERRTLEQVVLAATTTSTDRVEAT